MNSGVYKITNTRTGKFYVGSSYQLRERRRCHELAIINGVHTAAMRNAFRGLGSFRFEVVEECTPENLATREAHWITKLQPPLNCIASINRNRHAIPRTPKRKRR